MKNKLIALSLATLFTVFSTNAQNRKIEKAHRDFSNYNFNQAINQYEALVKNGANTPIIYQNLGDANYLNANYKEAVKWYGFLANHKESTIDIEHMYRYAVTLRTLKRYDESDRWMTKVNEAKQTDIRGQNFINSKNYLEKIENRFGAYTIHNLSINSKGSDFSPSFYNDNLVFSSSRTTKLKSKNIHKWNEKGYLNFYIATLSENGNFTTVKPFSKQLNTKLHESSAVFTKDGKTVYFTRNNGNSNRFKRDKKGFSRLQIFRAKIKNDTWVDIQPLPFNSANYSVAHPTLNNAEDRLYFSSNLPGTLGQSDIWVVEIYPDDNLGTPVNLGPKINTESKETFPFITADDILYFSSDGHPGLGGMDIFATDIKNLENNQIINVGAPINSIYDDFSMIINTSTKKGYFSSDRINGTGSDDIYSFLELKPINFNDNFDSKTLMATESKENTLSSTNSNTAHNLSNETNNSSEIYNVINSENHNDKKKSSLFKSINRKSIEGVDIALSIDLKNKETSQNSVNSKKLGTIYFGFDKSSIVEESVPVLAKVILYMRANLDSKINVQSHTDSRGNENYNMALSKKRVKGTIAYLTAQGIDASRISGKGYGETQLVNKCSDNTKCSEDKHQKNRRSEFITLNNY